MISWPPSVANSVDKRQPEPRLPKGSAREDGKVVWGYRRGKVWWVTPEMFARRQGKDRERSARRRAEQPEYTRAHARNAQRKRYARDPEKIKGYKRAWYAANAEKERARARRRQAATLAYAAQLSANRRARQRGAATHLSESGRKTVAVIYQTCRRVTKCLGVAFHVDHVNPLALGGKHEPSNLQILPASVNRAKGAKSPEEFNLHFLKAGLLLV